MTDIELGGYRVRFRKKRSLGVLSETFTGSDKKLSPSEEEYSEKLPKCYDHAAALADNLALVDINRLELLLNRKATCRLEDVPSSLVNTKSRGAVDFEGKWHYLPLDSELVSQNTGDGSKLVYFDAFVKNRLHEALVSGVKHKSRDERISEKHRIIRYFKMDIWNDENGAVAAYYLIETIILLSSILLTWMSCLQIIPLDWRWLLIMITVGVTLFSIGQQAILSHYLRPFTSHSLVSSYSLIIACFLYSASWFVDIYFPTYNRAFLWAAQFVALMIYSYSVISQSRYYPTKDQMIQFHARIQYLYRLNDQSLRPHSYVATLLQTLCFWSFPLILSTASISYNRLVNLCILCPFIIYGVIQIYSLPNHAFVHSYYLYRAPPYQIPQRCQNQSFMERINFLYSFYCMAFVVFLAFAMSGIFRHPIVALADQSASPFYFYRLMSYQERHFWLYVLLGAFALVIFRLIVMIMYLFSIRAILYSPRPHDDLYVSRDYLSAKINNARLNPFPSLRHLLKEEESSSSSKKKPFGESPPHKSVSSSSSSKPHGKSRSRKSSDSGPSMKHSSKSNFHGPPSDSRSTASTVDDFPRETFDDL